MSRDLGASGIDLTTPSTWIALDLMATTSAPGPSDAGSGSADLGPLVGTAMSDLVRSLDAAGDPGLLGAWVNLPDEGPPVVAGLAELRAAPVPADLDDDALTLLLIADLDLTQDAWTAPVQTASGPATSVRARHRVETDEWGAQRIEELHLVHWNRADRGLVITLSQRWQDLAAAALGHPALHDLARGIGGL